MSNTEDNEWLLDSVIGFLKSPLWINPIQSFVDENCLIFDNEEEQKFEYTEIHNRFKEMVDNLLEMHLQEMGVSIEQFISFCSSKKNEDLTEVLIDHLMAFDDFQAFKKMMEERNMELELEAIKALKSKQISFLSNEEKDNLQLEIAISASLREEENKKNQLNQEEDDLRRAIAMSMSLVDQQATNSNTSLSSSDTSKNWSEKLVKETQQQKAADKNKRDVFIQDLLMPKESNKESEEIERLEKEKFQKLKSLKEERALKSKKVESNSSESQPVRLQPVNSNEATSVRKSIMLDLKQKLINQNKARREELLNRSALKNEEITKKEDGSSDQQDKPKISKSLTSMFYEEINKEKQKFPGNFKGKESYEAKLSNRRKIMENIFSNANVEVPDEFNNSE